MSDTFQMRLSIDYDLLIQLGLYAISQGEDVLDTINRLLEDWLCEHEPTYCPRECE